MRGRERERERMESNGKESMEQIGLVLAKDMMARARLCCVHWMFCESVHKLLHFVAILNQAYKFEV